MRTQDFFRSLYEEWVASVPTPAEMGSAPGSTVEIFKNPGRGEVASLLKQGRHNALRAFLVGRDAIVWNAEFALHHSIDKKYGVGNKAISVVLGMADNKVIVTDYNWESGSSWYHNPATQRAILTHPWVSKNLPNPEVDYFDEMSVGRWEDL